MPPRGRGGKFSKPSRGGGKHFSRDLQPLDKEGNPIGMWRDPQDKTKDEETSSEEESSEEESDEEEDGPSGAGQEDLTREERRQLAKKKKQEAIARKNKKVAEPGDLPTDSEEEESEEVEEGDVPSNPNHTAKSRKQAQAVTTVSGEAAAPKKSGDKENLSRREKEAIAAQQAKERYQKLHAEGKTDEAKADLARLKLIREQRDQATARKQAEKEEQDERAKENKDRLEKEDKKRAEALGAAGEKKAIKGGKKK